MWTKFPTAAPPVDNLATPPTDSDWDNKITKAEVATILKSCKNRSSPGLDRVNYKTLKLINKKHPALLQTLFTECIKHMTFPKIWKRRKVVWLRKLGKDPTTPGAYRPSLCSALSAKPWRKS
jgi:hypothetical protein